MLAFIYLACQMMALLLETVPIFSDTWIDCLGDLSRYRLAIGKHNEPHARRLLETEYPFRPDAPPGFDEAATDQHDNRATHSANLYPSRDPEDSREQSSARQPHPPATIYLAPILNEGSHIFSRQLYPLHCILQPGSQMPAVWLVTDLFQVFDSNVFELWIASSGVM